MYPDRIEHYYAPTRVDDALALLARHGSSAKILAGGQSLLQQMRARKLAAGAIVDINRVEGLDAISSHEGGVRVGALVRFRAAASHPVLVSYYSALAEAAAAIGDRQVRNRGTLVGSIVFAAHFGDIAPAAVALGGELAIVGGSARDGSGVVRMHSVEGFAPEPGTCALEPHELVVALDLPARTGRSGSAYRKHGRVHQDRAVVSVAAWLALDSQGTCADVRLALGGLEGPVSRAPRAEVILRSSSVDADLFDKAGALAAETIPTQTDELASGEYRTQLIRILVPQALNAAHRRAEQEA